VATAYLHTPLPQPARWNNARALEAADRVVLEHAHEAHVAGVAAIWMSCGRGCSFRLSSRPDRRAERL